MQSNLGVLLCFSGKISIFPQHSFSTKYGNTLQKWSSNSACIYTFNSPPVTIIPRGQQLLSCSFLTWKWLAVIHSSAHSSSDPVLKRQQLSPNPMQQKAQTSYKNSCLITQVKSSSLCYLFLASD